MSGFTMSRERLEGHGAEQRCVVRSAQHHRRGGAVSSDLNAALGHLPPDGRTVGERELGNPLSIALSTRWS